MEKVLNTVSVHSEGTGCPEIPDSLRNEWQSIVDLIARIAKVRAALIMRVKNSEIEVFISSKTENSPYCRGDRNYLPDSGLYCEEVVKTQKMLLVPDASRSERWRNNPDMKYNMKCYLGFPVRCPDGTPFGTICVLDDKENHFSQDIRDFMEKMRNLIESYLKLLHLSITDPLTGLYNRTHLDTALPEKMERADRDNTPLSALLLDVDVFKGINDTLGHLGGDSVLKRIAAVIRASLRNSDIAFRYGGDEFFVLLPDTDLAEALRLAEQLRAAVQSSRIHHGLAVTVSIGAAERAQGEPLDHWFTRADRALYRVKRSRGRAGG